MAQLGNACITSIHTRSMHAIYAGLNRLERSMVVRLLNPCVSQWNWARGTKLFALQHGITISSGLTVLLSGAGILFFSISVAIITDVWLLGALSGLALIAVLLHIPQRAYQAQEALVARQMIEVFRSSTVALRAGKSLVQTVSYVAERIDYPLQHIFLEAAFQYSLGQGQRAVVQHLQKHLHAPGAQLYSSALQIALQTGSGVGEVFERASISLEKAQRQERALRAKTAQARLSAQVVGVMPLLLVLALSALSPDFRAGMNSLVGGCTLLIAGGLDLLGLTIMQRIMRRAIPRKEEW